MYIYETCCFVKKHKSLFKTASESNSRLKRNCDRLIMKVPPKSMKYSKSCLTMCVRIFNEIPNYIKILPEKLFKKQLYKWLNDKNFYSIKEFFDML